MIKSLLQLTRLYNLIIILLCQVLLAVRIEKIEFTSLLTNLDFLLLIISTVMIAAAGNIINDYYDVKIDYINKPNKVIVGSEIPRRWAMLFHAVLSYTGVAIGFYINWKIGIIDIFVVFLLWFYSNKLKCTPLFGNISIALLTALVVMVLPFYFGNFYREYWAFAYFAFIITLIRELTKDLEDMQGDSVFNCNTFPNKYGLSASKKLLISFETIFIFSLLYPLLEANLELKIYVLSIILSSSLMMIVMTVKSSNKRHFKNISKVQKFIILAGILSSFLI